jgi:hypothetical protein
MANQQNSPLREPPDVLLCQRTIRLLQLENTQLKERLTLHLASLAALKHQIKTNY